MFSLPNGASMVTEGILFLRFNSLLVLFLILLFLYDLQESIALSLRLLSKLDLVLQELLLASLVKLHSLDLRL